MKKLMHSAGIAFLWMLAGMPDALGQVPSPYDAKPFNVDAQGIAGSNPLGFFQRNGNPQMLRYFIGPDATLIMDFATAFTDGPGNDFAILTSSDSWNPQGAHTVRFDFVLGSNLQDSFDASLLPDQLFEFDLPGVGLIVDRVMVTSLDGTTTFDDAGVSYLVPEPSTISLLSFGVGAVFLYARFRLRKEELNRLPSPGHRQGLG